MRWDVYQTGLHLPAENIWNSQKRPVHAETGQNKIQYDMEG